MNYQKELQNPIFNIVSKVADQLSYPTYVVGGWVRDMLINSVDYVVNLRKEQIMETPSRIIKMGANGEIIKIR